MKNRLLTKIAILFLAFAMLIPMLASCSVRKVPAGKLALTPVGTVGETEVLYEELYYLVSNYLPSLKATYGDDTDGLKEALKEAVYENIVTNSAILSLCDDAGVSVDERMLSENVQEEIDRFVEEECNSKRSDYRDMLKSVGMTDHYMRYTTRVDLLYSELPTKYAEKGIIPNGDAEITDFVYENFVRTRHIAIIVEEGESYEENKEKALTALDKYKAGEYTFYKLIGSIYNEDLSPLTSDAGYYFARGSMDKAYEDTAFSLEINGVSDIVESVGQSNITGKTVKAFYIIQRLEIDGEYVSKNLADMQDKCADAIIGQKLDECKQELEFTPNDFCASLDLTSLDYPKDAFDFFVLFIVLGCVAVCGGVAGIMVFSAKRRQKRIAQRRAKNALK